MPMRHSLPTPLRSGRNIIHGSDAPESAAKEIGLWCVRPCACV